ncbi:TIGR03885 family FMN-dependent LLM class oxidoreductase [Mycolicibacter longobardus]|uniref:LLM class F420-dependent oxidoreductase n=1 Tax=Mycolicibacter longobardus TaxID=1108812 RepID=A0A1X1Y628_9MYCO|nr:TIGR03885 family FMN-dependent LLM class oxidoreductase [Mycolicibacter longobardus]MCV7382951.1 TIGR03885 family FMN-dependent LLM class oxidoreductase [Mycolicibacter longobardus]ORW06474.1 LLM class F420-dependent oxidoreductase [Mycolicibacter longobardus]
MAEFGFHASHEQIAPSALLEMVGEAERAGFQTAMCSDHFAPWSHSQGHSGFAWAWLGAALARTALPFGVVSAPGQRYHPAIIAQASATLTEMFPGRFWVAFGSGQALNEHITGDRWPGKAERNARLLEAVEVVRALLTGETVSHDGHFRVDRATLYSRPDQPPPIVGAAVTAQTAHWVGGWADGLITVNQPIERLRQVIGAFRDGGGDDKPVRLQVHLSYHPDEATALAIAHDQWRYGIIGSEVGWALETPEDFEQVAAYIRPDDVRPHVLVSSSLNQHSQWLHEYAELGVNALYLHHVGKQQRQFIEAFGTEVLPELIS